MSPDVAVQLRHYLETVETAAPPITTAELERARGGGNSELAPDGDLVVADLREPEVRPEPGRRRRWVAAAAAAAAIGLAVTALVVDRDSSTTGTVSATSRTSSGPDSLSTPLDAATPAEAQDSEVWTSVDGLTWSPVVTGGLFDGPLDHTWGAVTAGGPGVVAVGLVGRLTDPPPGQDAAVWTSEDGFTWSRVPHDAEVFGGDDSQWMNDVTVGGPGLVAVGIGLPNEETAAASATDEESDAAVWTSEDGINWSRVAHDEAAFGGGYMRGVIAAGPGLVAVGNVADSAGDSDGAVWTSEDGIAWSRVAHDEEVFGGPRNQTIEDVTVGGPGLVAVGRDGHGAIDNSGDQIPAVWTSVDGITWSRVPPEAIPADAVDSAMWSVTAGGPGLVAVGHEWLAAAAWTSEDGLTWDLVTDVPQDEQAFGEMMVDVVAGGPGLVAVGSAVWTSSDGLNWSAATAREPNSGDAMFWSVATAGPGLVAFGE